MPKSKTLMNKTLSDYRKSLGLFPFSGWAISKREAKRLADKYRGPLLREQPKDYET